MPRVKIPFIAMIFTYIAFAVLIVTGHIRDMINRMFNRKYFSRFQYKDGLAPIFTPFESFFSRRLYRRIADCFGFPITGVPGRKITVLERESKDENKTFTLTGKKKKLLNFGSYNYLGFACKKGPVTEEVIKSFSYPLTISAPSRDTGVSKPVSDLEREMASFLYQEDCIVFSMGYGTNTSNIPVLFGEGTLVLSDELNHASLISGLKLSKAVVRVFRHNDMTDLRSKLVFYISQGQPVTHRTWKKIIVMVEGIYSMEGTIVNLRELVELKRIYKFYVFLDEAHSIGALGKSGRGVCEHLGVDFSEVDVFMGTFTKSFGGMGGYIAGSKILIDYLRFFSDFSLYGDQMPPLIATQVLASLKCIKGTSTGEKKLKRLKCNTVLMRSELNKKGFIVLGDKYSPVIPVILSNPGKMGEFSRKCEKEGLAVVIVGYPATPVLFGRVRLCVSSSHKKSDILRTVEILGGIGDLLGITGLR